MKKSLAEKSLTTRRLDCLQAFMMINCFRKTFILILVFLAAIFSIFISPVSSQASSGCSNKSASAVSSNQSTIPDPWYNNIDAQWGGHIKIRGSVLWPDEESYSQPASADPYYDGLTKMRLKSKFFFGEWGNFETHYEAILSGGDSRRKGKALEQLYPNLFSAGVITRDSISDKHRLMDLTKSIDEDDNYIIYHRIDRLCLTLLPKWGVVHMGRQVVTWGNGLLFNPMDIFNPFSPSDIEREYKIGDDMVSTQFPIKKTGDLQLLYVPRREQVSGNVEWNQSSLAGKLHFAQGVTEFDIMAAKHYKDTLIGFGSAGYLGNTAWRLDSTWTFLDKNRENDNYLSFVANMDYSWVWWKKNLYGYLEYYFNGLCHNQYTEEYSDPDISERINRGELFTLGRNYLSGHIRVELHPLLNIYLTMINNLADPSGSLQPRAVWNITQDMQITVGSSLYFGGKNTEYGGYKIAGTDFRNNTF
ncbi:MAG: hypothetical protein JRD93_19965 [Deltaproteobacteria bacterium]|nr:hypothetical protein [Deltaproteobacteria bacterium]